MWNKRHALMTLAWGLLIGLGIVTGLAVHRLWVFRSGLEELADQLTLDVGPESTLIFDSKDNLVSALFEQHRMGVPLEEMSPHLINAVLVTEDRRFYDHDGIDIRRILAAAVANTRAGEIVQGGSTITQQLVRSILLDREQTYERKIKEAILARRLEERYAKRAILESYLNRVYFGDGYYGVQAAAIGYFGKKASELSVVESAILAGLIKGPSLYSPTKNPELTRGRRDLVLEEMRADGLLSDQEFQEAVSVPVATLIAQGDKTGVPDPRHAHGGEYFRETVTRELIERFGEDAVYTGGLRVYTTLDRDLQRLAESVIDARLKGVPRGGPDPLQGALVALDPRTGHVKAIVGGRNFHESPFNRATDAARQPGSAFKPFIYAMALESGYSPGSQLKDLDQPIPSFQGPWLPNGEHEVVSVSLRTGLVQSSNRAAAHLLQEVGVQRTLDLVQRFGIHSPMPAVPSVALGTGEMSLFELTSAYGVFANQGVLKPPTLIRRIVDRYGRELYREPEGERRVISEATAYMMTSMMSDVIDHGTAITARAQGFRLHAAGKTGTSQDYTDAWFVGFTKDLVAGIWFGYDKPRPIINRCFASVVAVPAWTRFMMAATRGSKDEWYDLPGSLVKVKLCRISGQLATDRCHLPVYELPPYNPNNPDVMAATTPVAREGGVYEDVLPYDRVPQPCTLLHGDPSAVAPPAQYDPALAAPSAYRTAATLPEPPEPPKGIMTVEMGSGDQSRPVTPPPAFMTERAGSGTVTPVTVTPVSSVERPAPAPAAPAAAPVVIVPPTPAPATAAPAPAQPERVTPPAPTAATPAPAAKPETEVENPLISRAKPTKEAPPAEAPDAPLVPGTKVEKTPPPPPKTPRPPGL